MKDWIEWTGLGMINRWSVFCMICSCTFVCQGAYLHESASVFCFVLFLHLVNKIQVCSLGCQEIYTYMNRVMSF